MKSLSLYEDKQSFLNGLTPGCKAFYIIAALVIPAMLGNKLISIGFIVLSIPQNTANPCSIWICIDHCNYYSGIVPCR